MPSDSVPSSRSARPVQETSIYVAGHRGMVGSALVRRLHAGGYAKLVLRTRAELDLLDQRAVREFMAAERPDYVFVAAAKVGGIQANNIYRADFLHDNLVIETPEPAGFLVGCDGSQPEDLLSKTSGEALS